MSSLLNLSPRPCLGKQACWLAGEGAPELPCSAASAVHDSLVLSYSGLFQVGRHPGPHLTNTRIISTTCTFSCKLSFTTGPQKHRPRHIRRCRGANDQSERRHIRLKVRQRAGRAQRGAEHTASKQKEQQWSALRPQFVHRATHHLAIRARIRIGKVTPTTWEEKEGEIIDARASCTDDATKAVARWPAHQRVGDTTIAVTIAAGVTDRGAEML